MIPREKVKTPAQACLQAGVTTFDRQQTPRRSGFSQKKREIRGGWRIA